MMKAGLLLFTLPAMPLMAMARMASADEPEAAQMLNQTRLQLDGRTLQLTVEMTEQQVADALAKSESRGG